MIDSILRGLPQPEYVHAFDVGQLQLFGRSHNETLSVVAVRISNEERPAVGIHGGVHVLSKKNALP